MTDPTDPEEETPPKKRVAAKPDHYRVICVSLYNEDHDRALEMVAALKKRGFSRMSLSRLLRVALEHTTADDLAAALRAKGITR